MMGVFQPLAARPLDDVGNGLGGVVVVDGDADHLRAGAGEGGDLLDGAFDVGGVGVGHGLHDDGVRRSPVRTPPMLTVTDFSTAMDVRHRKLSASYKGITGR